MSAKITLPPLGLMDQGWAEPGMTDAESYAASLETIKLADRVGIDTAWIGEHHYVQTENPFYGRIPASEMFLAHAAAQTSRIMLGTGVKVLSTTTALRAAEEMAVLDVLSGGRANSASVLVRPAIPTSPARRKPQPSAGFSTTSSPS